MGVLSKEFTAKKIQEALMLLNTDMLSGPKVYLLTNFRVIIRIVTKLSRALFGGVACSFSLFFPPPPQLQRSLGV